MKNIKFTDYVPDDSRLLLNWKKWQWPHNFSTWRYHIIFWRCFASIAMFSYWSKFHVNIIAGSGVMITFFFKRLTRNLEIVNTSVGILSNIWRLGQVMDKQFATNVSNKILLNAAKCQSYSFYRVSVIIGKTNRGVEVNLPPPRLGLMFKCDWF